MSKLQEQIDEFIQSVGEAPAQRSKEWYEMKSKTIGGSEVATVLGINPFRQVKALIAEKTGVAADSFCGNMATRWGTLFEHLTREWTEQVLLLEKPIRETGSIPGVIERQRYSPDGLGVVRLINEKNKLDNYIVLFEFKSPFRSIPDGNIPKYYVPQIQTGMLTIPLVEVSIFVSNCFRKCQLKQLGFDASYDKVFHDGDAKKKANLDTVLACGVICFYQTKQDYETAVKQCGYGSDTESDESISDDVPVSATNSSYDMELLMNTVDDPLDFGAAKERMLNRLFELCEEKRVKVSYQPMILNQSEINKLEFIRTHKKTRPVVPVEPKKLVKAQIGQFEATCEEDENYLIGYLPWKLFKSDIILDTPDEDWRDKIEPRINDTIEKIDAILASDDPSAKYLEYFPGSNIHVEVELVETDIMKKSSDSEEEIVL